MARRIAILTGSHLCHNPRVWKEAATLAEAGFAVDVFGAWQSASLKQQDRELLSDARFKFVPVVDHTISSGWSRVTSFARRLRNKLGPMLFSVSGAENAWQLGTTVPALRRAAGASNADLFIAHSEAGMLVARDLYRRGRRVGIDMEDWFSEDLLPAARRLRPVKLLRRLERELLNGASYSSCPSQAMSSALAQEYGCQPPAVIYNAFPWSERNAIDGLARDRCDRQQPSIHWYSQTLGPGRGLEDLLASLPHLKNDCQIHLRGNPVVGFQGWLNSRTPEKWRNRIVLHGLVPNHELLSRIAEHDIGFAGEMKYSRSRDLTVTNKLLHYLLAGLPVVASDTTGQQEVAKAAAGAVLVYPAARPYELAARLDHLLGSPERLRVARAAAVGAAHLVFSWERIAPSLIESIERALQNGESGS